MGQHQLATLPVRHRVERFGIYRLGVDQLVEHVNALAAGEGARDRQKFGERERVDQHGFRHRRANPGVERGVSGKCLAAGEEHPGRVEARLDQPQREARIAGEHGHAVPVAYLDGAFRLAGTERDAGDAVRLHLRLVEQPGDEQVVAEGHRTDIAFTDSAGGEMRPRRRDHALEIAPGLEDRHQRRAHRGQVDADRPCPAERAVARFCHLGDEIHAGHQGHGGGEFFLVGNRLRKTPTIERMGAEPLERPVYGLAGEAHQRLASASAAESS